MGAPSRSAASTWEQGAKVSAKKWLVSPEFPGYTAALLHGSKFRRTLRGSVSEKQDATAKKDVLI